MMLTFHIIPSFGLILYGLISVTAQLFEAPSDVTGVVGDTITLTCRVDPGDAVTWRENINTSSGSTIYFGGNLRYPDKHRIEGTYNLVIKQANSQDGGEYSCETITQQEKANVHVFDSKPVIELGDPTENLPTNVSCSATLVSKEGLADSDLPTTKLFFRETELPGPKLTSTENTSFGTDQQSRYTINGLGSYAPTLDDVGLEIECIIVNGSGVEYPVPVSSTIKLSLDNIKYMPRNIILPDNNTEYQVGQTISCVADGNPKPENDNNFIWTPIQTPTVMSPIRRKDIAIDEKMVYKNKSATENIWSCTAMNGIGGSLTKSIVFIVIFAKETGKNQNSTNPLLPGVVVLAILLFVCIILLIVLFMKYKKKTGFKSHIPDQYITTPGAVNSNNMDYQNAATLQLDVRSDVRTYEHVNVNDVRPVGEDPYTNLQN